MTINTEQKPGRVGLHTFGLDDLTDWSFTRFITVRLVKVLYLAGIVLLALVAMAIGFSGFRVSFIAGLGTLITAPIFFVLALVALRVYLELVVALFRIAENTGALVKKAEAQTTATPHG